MFDDEILNWAVLLMAEMMFLSSTAAALFLQHVLQHLAID